MDCELAPHLVTDLAIAKVLALAPLKGFVSGHQSVQLSEPAKGNESEPSMVFWLVQPKAIALVLQTEICLVIELVRRLAPKSAR